MENNSTNIPNNNRQGRGKGFTALVLAATLLITNFATWNISRSVTRSTSISVEGASKVATEYINKMVYLASQIKENYLWADEIDEEELWIYATKGLIAGTGDLYSSYMTEQEYENYKQNSTNFDGIGVQITNNEQGNVEIIKVFKDTPADDAGLLIGDQILAADGESLIGQSTEVAVTKLRGEKGTTVEIEILRSGITDPFTVKVIRNTIINSFVDQKLIDGNIGYIYLSEFGEDAAQSFKTALNSLIGQGAKGIILDMRQNPGGNVRDALSIADQLLGKCEIIYTADNEGNREDHNSDAACYDGPLVVLIDQNSASASEIVAGSLQDNGRAILIGHKSFGKGIIQYIRQLEDGSTFKLTYQEYYVPSGKTIHNTGITPDIEVDLPEEYRSMAVERIPDGSDSQLVRAIEEIKKQL